MKKDFFQHFEPSDKIDFCPFPSKTVFQFASCRNTPRLRQWRHDFVRQSARVSRENLCFLDEPGFDLKVTPFRWYAPTGKPPRFESSPDKGVNLSLLCLIDGEGVLAYDMQDGAYDRNGFLHFLDDCGDVLEGKTIVLDNAPIHKGQAVCIVLSKYYYFITVQNF